MQQLQAFTLCKKIFDSYRSLKRGATMNQLIQKSPRKDCYFLAIKRALYEQRLARATKARQERQQFINFKNLVLTMLVQML